MRSPGAAALALGLVVLLSGRASSSAGAAAAPRAGHESARAYATAKAPAMVARWNDTTIRRALERYAPHYLPGVPLEAVLCLGASSTGPTEDLGAAVGLFGVERSNIDAWARDEETREQLRRSYDAAHYAVDIEAQVYTGCRRYAAALYEGLRIVGQAPASTSGAWWSTASLSPWEYQAIVSIYSAGGGTFGRLLTPRRSTLAPIEPGRRFSTLATDVAARGSSGASTVDGVPLRGLVGAAWAVTRPRERYETARAVTAALRRPAGWYTDPGVSTAVDARLSGWTHGGT